MPEWFNGAVLKTVDVKSVRGFESLSLRQLVMESIVSNKVVSEEAINKTVELIVAVIKSWPEEDVIPKSIAIETVTLEFAALLHETADP